jgi:5-methylcytosine-specific restriction endonuclease McrA
MSERRRTPIPRSVQVEVYFRDHWLCTYCHRPTVFPPAFELLTESIASELPDIPIAIYDGLWRRDKAPLLDELAACIDHIQPLADGGAHDVSNFTTCCARCNARKSNRSAVDYLKENPPWEVKGKYGEPKDWDGLASLFVVLARKAQRPLTRTEKDWLRAIEAHYDQQRVR